MRTRSIVPAFLGALFLTTTIAHADPTPLSALQSAASALQATKSLTASVSLSDTSIATGAESTLNPTLGGTITLSRPGLSMIDVKSADPKQAGTAIVLSNASGQYFSSGNQYVKASAADAEIIFSIFMGPVRDYFDPSLSPAAEVLEARDDGFLTSCVLTPSAQWNGSTYTVVRSVFSRPPTALKDMLSTVCGPSHAAGPVTESDYIGQDGIIHRIVLEEGDTELDFQVSDINLDTPIDTGVFELPKGAIVSSREANNEEPPAEPPLLADGKTAPRFTVHDVHGRRIRLTDYRGKIVVVDFWATWCGPCQDSLPGVEQIARKYKSCGVVVLAVNVWDTEKAFKKWLPEHRKFSDLVFAIDPNPDQDKSVATKYYNVSGIPTDYVISRTGIIVSSSVGDDGGAGLLDGLKKALRR